MTIRATEEQQKISEERERERQRQLAAYTKDRAAQCLVVAEAECDDLGNPIKVVRGFFKGHPVSSRHTIEGCKQFVRKNNGVNDNCLVVILPDRETYEVEVPMGERDENGVPEKVRHVLNLGAARGALVVVPPLTEAEDLGSRTIDLFEAIQAACQ